MGMQGFSQRLRLATAVNRVKGERSSPVSEEEKARRKQLAKARADKLLAENLAQRALVQSKRA